MKVNDFEIYKAISFKIIAIIFSIELISMFIIDYLNRSFTFSTLEEAFIDSTILSVLSIFPLTIFVIKPVVKKFSKYKKDVLLFAEAVEANQHATVIFNDQFKIEFANKSFITLFNYSDVLQFKGKSFFDHYDSSNNADSPEKLIKNVQDYGSWQGKIIAIKSDQEIFPSKVQFNCINYHEKQYFVGIFEDISEVILIEKQRQESHKMAAMQSLTAGFAHNFNNILTGILGNIYLIEKKDQAGDMKVARSIENLCSRASAIIKQLMMFSKQGLQDRSDFILNDIISDAIEEMPNKCFKLILPENKKIKFYGNYNAILKSIKCLLENAVEARENNINSMVIVEFKECSGADCGLKSEGLSDHLRSCCLTITNKGTIILKENHTKVFDPFYSTKDAAYGRGLGLSMAKGVFDSHGAHISLKSSEEDQTTFNVCFPIIGSKKA